MEGRLYCITDTYGSYYGLNPANKLVPVGDEEHATRFTFIKANNVIQNSIKPMQRYQYVLKEASIEEKQENYSDMEDGDYIPTRFDGMDTNWNEYVEELISFSSQLRQYRLNLNYMLSEVDKEICDIMHYIEFYNLDAAKGYKTYKMLKDCRLRRRKIKDEYEKVSAAITVFANDDLIDKLKNALHQMKGLDARTYKPRVLAELFEEVS